MSDWGICPSCRVGRLATTSRGTLACTTFYDLSHPGPGGVMIHGGMRCGYEAMPPLLSPQTAPPLTQSAAAPTQGARRAIQKSPSRGLLYGQLVVLVASPLNGLARSLNGLFVGLTVALSGVLEKKGSDEILSDAPPASRAATMREVTKL
jgi:hypothetical protein